MPRKSLTFSQFNPDYPGFLLAVLPPGAFFGLAIADRRQKLVRSATGSEQQAITPAVSAETYMNRDKRQEIFTRLTRTHRRIRVQISSISSHFELLIAVLLSAQATDISVNKATAKLYPLANTPAT